MSGFEALGLGMSPEALKYPSFGFRVQGAGLLAGPSFKRTGRALYLVLQSGTFGKMAPYCENLIKTAWVFERHR